MFHGKVVFITGASSGIGEALAAELARHSARLALFARRKERLEEVAHAAERMGAQGALALAGDVREPESLAKAVQVVRSTWGRIDMAILSAGVGQPTTLRSYNTDRMRETVEINLLGVIHATGALLPVFREQGGGLLVGISSLADGRGSPLNLAYCASKAGYGQLPGRRSCRRREGRDPCRRREARVRPDPHVGRESLLHALSRRTGRRCQGGPEGDQTRQEDRSVSMAHGTSRCPLQPVARPFVRPSYEGHDAVGAIRELISEWYQVLGIRDQPLPPPPLIREHWGEGGG